MKIDTAEMLDPKGKNSHGTKNTGTHGDKQKTPPPPPRHQPQPQDTSRALAVPTAASHQHTQPTSSSQPLYVSTSPVSNSSPVHPSPQKIPSPHKIQDVSQGEQSHSGNYNYHPFNNTTKTDSSSSSGVKGGIKTSATAKQRLEMMKTAPHDLSDLHNDFYHKNATQYSTDQFAK